MNAIMRRIFCRAIFVLSVITLALSATPAGAVDFQWNVAGPADWNVGTNWNPEGPPSGGNGDHGFVNNGGTAVISADIPDIQDIFVGNGAGTSGTLNQTGGTVHGGAGAQNGWTFVGQNGGTGTYNLSGGTSDNERLYIGRLGGTGTANISGTGLAQWATTNGAGEFVVGIDAGSMGTANMSGTGRVNTGLVLFGVGGAAGNFAIGNLAMSGDSSITSGGNVELQNGTYSVTDNAVIDAGNEVWVGQATGRSATLNQNSGVVEANTWIAIGRAGSTGVVNLSGDAAMRKLVVDDGNPATISNSEASFIVLAGLGTNGSGTLNVMDAATVESDNGMVLGEDSNNSGVVNQSGGTVTLHDWTPRVDPNQPIGVSLVVGNRQQDGDQNTGNNAYNLSGGTLNAETIVLNAGRFIKTGGVLNFTSFEMNGGTLSADTFNGDLNQNGGTVSPGASPGTMTITGDYSLNSGDLFIELDGLAAGTQYDQLIVTGDVSLAGDLTLDVGFSPSLGDMFTIINNQGTNPVSGMFSQGSSISAGGFLFGINYGGGDGNDVVLTVVPEPSTALLGLVMTGLITIAVQRRQRHRAA
jgi:fibronectin-binding autotransporter adhesin